MTRKLWLRVGLLAGVAVLLGTVVGVVIATREVAPETAEAIGARLELAAGEVLVDQGRGETRAVSGTALAARAKVKTAAGARALVRLPDGSSLFLRGGSAVELSPDAVVLSAGEYWLDAPPVEREALVHRLGEVSVTAVDAGLSLKQSGEGAVVYVARGMAVLTAPGGRVEVNAGEQASVGGKDAPKVAAVAFWDDWTGGMADLDLSSGALGEGTGAIYGVDVGAEPGSPSRRLELKSQSVRAVIREGLSETAVDQTFYNPGERAVEGWYWFTVPAAASVTGFAVETAGQLVEGEFIERREAAAKYTAAKETGHAPAILEWVDARTYRARIFPVPASGTRRVVLRYVELRTIVDETVEYVYPMGRGEPVRIGEFSLRVDLGEAGTAMQIATLADARVEAGGKLVTMRRSGYTPRADFQLEAKAQQGRAALTVSRFKNTGEGADYAMVRYTPDIDWSQVAEPRGDVVVVVDTSAAGDEASRQLKATVAEAILRALSAEDRFALVSLDVKPTVLYPAEGLAAAKEEELAKALERLAEHASGGATDLASSFEVALKRVHGAEQPAVVYVGDGVATSGEMTGEQLVERLRRALSTSRARLFTVGVGTEADHGLLGELARAGGGESLRVDAASEATSQALELAAALKVPTITDFEIDLGAGLDEPFVSSAGKVSRGAEVLVLARTHHEIPGKVTVKGRVGGKPFEKSYETQKDETVVQAFVPRLWAAEYVRRLLGAATGADEERGRIASLGIEYGLMTPYTSLLALESEVAYRQMGIERRRSPLRGVKLGALDAGAEHRLAATLAAGEPPALAFGCALMQKSDEEAAPAVQEPTEATAVAEAPAAPPADKQAPDPGWRGDDGVAAPSPDSPPASPAPGDALDDRPGGTGNRAKGEEGSMGDSRTRPPSVRMGVAARPSTGSASGGPTGGAVEPESSTSPDDERGRVDRSLREAKKAAQAQLQELDTKSREAPAGALVPLATCSDVSKRPLAHRVLLWKKRLSTARSPAELIERYEAALRGCELPDWTAEQTFLKLLQEKIDSQGGAVLVLRYFAWRPDVQKYVGKLILRRIVDAEIVAAVERELFGQAVDWNAVDLELQAIAELDERLAKLREYMARAPEDPNGDIRLVKLLVEGGKAGEALNHGRRLRDQGFLTLRIARQLGDVLARANEEAEAVRTYSEIVEFDPHSVASRQLLGDVYLSRGWYEPAYRQYKTTTELSPDDALGWLRLAAAAAGAGRVDEALRLERRVATSQGRPGPNDPRRWARLSSATRLGRLLAEPPKSGGVKPAALERELKELGLFRGPGTLVVLTWEDLSSDLELSTRVGEEAVSLGEVTDAAAVGLSARLLGEADFGRARFVARLRSVPREEPLGLSRYDIRWDGKAFKVVLARAELAARQTDVEL